jgi:Domain of unknown function (DUF3846)
MSDTGTIIFIPSRPHVSFLVEEVPWPMTLELMQTLVGGHVESFPIAPNGLLGWCNEDGWMLDLEPNVFATVTFERVLVGNVYITGWWDGKDDCLPLPSSVYQILKRDRMPLIHIDTVLEYCNGKKA